MKRSKKSPKNPQAATDCSSAIYGLWVAHEAEQAFVRSLRYAPPFTRERILWLMME